MSLSLVSKAEVKQWLAIMLYNLWRVLGTSAAHSHWPDLMAHLDSVGQLLKLPLDLLSNFSELLMPNKGTRFSCWTPASFKFMEFVKNQWRKVCPYFPHSSSMSLPSPISYLAFPLDHQPYRPTATPRPHPIQRQ